MAYSKYRIATFAAAAAASILISLAHRAEAADTVFIPQVVELSGPGAISGTNFRDGALLAIGEVNAAGGILGHQIKTTVLDTQSDPSVARAQMQRVVDQNPMVILGPIFTGSCLATMPIAAQAQIPQLIGGLGSTLTQQGDGFVFRTSLSQTAEMPEIASYLATNMHAKKVAILWVNNDYGKGGRDAFSAAVKKAGLDLVADVPAEQNLEDYSSAVTRLTSANPDAIFVYLNEDGSARFLIAANHSGVKTPIVGDSTLLGAKVVELAGEAANGIQGFVDLSVDMPVPNIDKFAAAFKKKYNYVPDENGIKGYTAIYIAKYAATRAGKVDPIAISSALHGMTINPKDMPQIFLSSTWTKDGDLQRAGFFAKVENGKQIIFATLPKLGQ
jgi:branched-chain amino acid transport system substrate-binding protein